MTITIDDVAKVEIKVGTIVHAEEVEGSEKLLKLSVDFGAREGEGGESSLGEHVSVKKDIRQVLSGIKKFVSREELIGKQFPFVTNLVPRDMMGMKSEAMILGAGSGETFALFQPTQPVPNGTRLK